MVSISFEGKVFGPVQAAMLELIAELERHVYHGPRLIWLLEDIAWAGRYAHFCGPHLGTDVIFRVQSGKGSEKVDLGYCNVLD